MINKLSYIWLYKTNRLFMSDSNNHLRLITKNNKF